MAAGVLAGVAGAGGDASLEGNQLAGGWYHSLALKADGSVWATGRNLYGQLGTGDTTDRITWTKVLDNVQTLAGGTHHSHSLALKKNGTLWATGLIVPLIDYRTLPAAY
jgi:hypothetical protein